MRWFKNILIGFGVLFALLIVFLISMYISSTHFKAEEAPVATAFMMDLSRRWVVHDVSERMANELLAQMATAQGQQTVQFLEQLGAMRSAQDIEMRNYFLTPTSGTALFTFKATFENGEAVVDVNVRKNQLGSRVLGFFVRITQTSPAIGPKAQTRIQPRFEERGSPRFS